MRVEILYLRCERMGEYGQEEVQIVVRSGERSLQFGPHTFQEVNEVWRDAAAVDVEPGATVELWEIDLGRTSWVNPDDRIGSGSFRTSAEPQEIRFSGSGSRYTMGYRTPDPEEARDRAPGPTAAPSASPNPTPARVPDRRNADGTWIVPARRYVVSRTVGYDALVDSWIAEIRLQSTALERWYGISGDALTGAIGAVEAWRSAALGAGVAVARDRAATLDRRGASFWVRLWKGPLRTVLEEEGSAQPLGDRIAHADNVEVQHGGVVRLELSERCEVTNADARFLMGDVVEFPLFKLLAAAGLTDYGSPPTYGDKIAFEPEGSCFLGTSVRYLVGSRESAQLHDNLPAMRFQLLLNACLGLGARLDEPVFTGNPSRAPSAVDGEHTVHARGLIYAGVLLNPTSGQVRGAPEYWRIESGRWGRVDSGGGALPTQEGIERLGRDLPVTPGMTCSPATLLLSHYMMRLYEGRYGQGSVGNSHANFPDIPMWDHYGWWPSDEVGELAPLVTEEDMREALERLITQVEDLLGQFDEHDGFIARALSDAEGQSGWTDVSERTRTGLLGERGDPRAFMRRVIRGLGRLAAPAERERLEPLRSDLVSGCEAFAQEFDELAASEDWGRFADTAPQFDRPNWPTIINNVREVGSRNRQGQIQSFAGLAELRRGLDRKLQQLERLRERDSLVGRERQATLDLTDRLTSVNVVSTSGHEWAVVKIHSHAKLADAPSLPQGDFLAAYDPLNGRSFFDASSDRRGQCYIFESTGSLSRRPGRVSLFGAGPFRWEKVPGNRFGIRVSGTARQPCTYFGEVRPRTKRLVGIARLSNELQGRDSLGCIQSAEPPIRPIFVHPSPDGSDQASARQRMVVNGMDMYHARSVPFSTIEEMRDGFPTGSQVERNLTAYLNEATEAPATQE